MKYQVKCPQCGSVRELTYKPKESTLCKSCSKKNLAKSGSIQYKEKICKFCNQLFTPESNHQEYCKRPHFRKCPICGELYLEDNTDNLKRPPVACSYECRVRKTQKTSMQKYGTLAPGNNKEAREKSRKTLKEKTGFENAMQNPETRDKARKTILSKYGVDNVSKLKEIIDRRMKTNRERYGDILPFNRPECYEKQHKTIFERYGVPYASSLPQAHQAFGRISKINKRFAKKLEDLGFQCELEKHIQGKFFDICIESQKLVIEIDPTYTHNSVGVGQLPPLDRYYHRDKTQLAEDNGYRCIHVFDWDDWNKLVDLILPRQRVFARDCQIFRLKKEVGDEFLNKYHLQGSCRGQLLYLGLVHEGELLQVMTFGKPRYDNKHYVELLRLCSKPGVQVVGGASKLFSFATSEYGLYSIISYCDRAKFNGDVYEKIGMHLLRVTPPQVIWSKEDKRITANLLLSRGYDQLFKTSYGKEYKNEELMLMNGWLPIYDSGQKVFGY